MKCNSKLFYNSGPIIILFDDESDDTFLINAILGAILLYANGADVKPTWTYRVSSTNLNHVVQAASIVGKYIIHFILWN